ncbi:1,6-anhydro-N-acetylmuramyl-L-alanine amidase AmpD [Zoogloea sp.]|uniref:1,6-anhydro-N-acetylmuramyl-L-alanine amidase AmpD n=1 Tax=Zoogloea sp. TaxID=49181 RepID=UPI001ACA80FE|nr:1,6-anhydro-N-acetylmuramyl-L-alanine amidase AmpD [Zoogloea sp.]MBN8283522.1 1,6-anhydro-N-acetylmuramyl-L-alanine amidase AmpD [Zoogloea sp.]
MEWQPSGWLTGVDHLPSPNFGERPANEAVTLIVIHNISLPPGQFGGGWVERFFVNGLDHTFHPYFEAIARIEVSAHFYILRDGRVIQFVGCDQRAWHAGDSCWEGRTNCNDFSVGIELEGSDLEPFSGLQYQALWPLLDALRQRYPISAIAGHSDISPGRKTDPGPFFDWSALRAHCAELRLPSEVTA